MPSESRLNQLSDEEFEKIVLSSHSVKEVCLKLGYTSHSGANSSKVKQRMTKLGLSTNQFKHIEPIKRNPENVFIENSTAAQKTLRKYYEKGHYTEYVCSICGQPPFWNGKPMILILDHKNGKHTDDRLERKYQREHS